MFPDIINIKENKRKPIMCRMYIHRLFLIQGHIFRSVETGENSTAS